MLEDGKIGQDIWLIDTTAPGPKSSPVRVAFIRGIEKVIWTEMDSLKEKIEIAYTIESYEEDGTEVKYPYQLYDNREEAMEDAKREFRKSIQLAEARLRVLREQYDSIDLYTEEEES